MIVPTTRWDRPILASEVGAVATARNQTAIQSCPNLLFLFSKKGRSKEEGSTSKEGEMFRNGRGPLGRNPIPRRETASISVWTRGVDVPTSVWTRGAMAHPGVRP